MSTAAASAASFDSSTCDKAPDLENAIERAVAGLVRLQHPDGHFVFDLEADAAIPAEYVIVKHFLGEPDPEAERGTANYLRRIQEPHGGWPMLSHGAPNVSASVKAYFALKIAGDSIDAPHMVRARETILAAGGAVNVNVFTKITLALFGIVPWRAVPVMPVEIMHAPRWFPFHIFKISFWARDTLIPLMVLMALKPRAKNPRNISIDELFVVPPHEVRHWPKTDNQTGFWGVAFSVLDRVLRTVEPLFPRRSRASAIEKAKAFVCERLNGEDGFGAIYPSIANTLMMFHLLGVPESHPDMIDARSAFKKLEARNGDELFCQPCLSPVWDTVLSACALMEAQRTTSHEVERALDWLKPLQVLDLAGDWAYQRPNLRPGGWAFMYNNPHYVDLDDTAAVVMAMDRARRDTETRRYDEAIARGREWVIGMQSANGGWASYDADNTSYYLNYIPFADHGRAARSADGRRGRPLRLDAGPARRSAGDQRADAARPRLPAGRAASRRQLVRPLGRQLHLRHLVHADGLQRGQLRSRPCRGASGRRLAHGDPERRRRLGRGRQWLCARLQRIRGGAEHRVADGLGTARPDGGRRGRQSRGPPRHRPPLGDAAGRRVLARYPPHRHRLSARLLSSLQRLLQILPDDRAGPLPQHKLRHDG